MTPTQELVRDVGRAIADLDTHLLALPRCSDGHCIIVKPKGMHTNGGCKCWRDPMLMQRYAHAHNRFVDVVRAHLQAMQEKNDAE